MPTGSSAAAASCEARSAEHPANGNTRRLLPGAERPATTESSPAAMERLSAPARRQAGGDRQVSGILVCHRAERSDEAPC